MYIYIVRINYSGTSPYGHLTSKKKTSPLQSPLLSPKLYSTVQITPCNKVTSPLRSLLPSPVGDHNSKVPLYIQFADTISDIYRIIKIRKLSAFRCYLRKSRHSAECTNADDFVCAYILSCHLVSRMKTTISIVLLIIGWLHSAPTLRMRAPHQ